MTRSRNSSKIRQLCLPYTPPAPLESQNLFFDAPTAAEIFWVSGCLARYSPRKIRNDSCNRLASNFLVGHSSTSGVRGTLPIAPSATIENPWDMFRADARLGKATNCCSPHDASSLSASSSRLQAKYVWSTADGPTAVHTSASRPGLCATRQGTLSSKSRPRSSATATLSTAVR